MRVAEEAVRGVVTEEAVRGGSRRRWSVGGRGGRGPYRSRRRWPVGVTEEVARGGSRRRRPRTGHGGGPCRSRRRRSVQVAEEVVRAGGGGELIQKFRILQVFLVFSLMKILYIDIKQKSPVKF